jgi:hypothetical protein
MKLTSKDKEFLEKLRSLFDEHSLHIESKRDGVSRLVLRKNYGTRAEMHFGMTRQGVRWRFQRLFNEIYIQAYVTIIWIESSFGTHLRQEAMAIARERLEMYRRAKESGEYAPGKARARR